MLAPIDKVRSRANDIIQIVVTRNCDVWSCGNCTQLLPYRQDAREMSLECAEEALISLREWPGVRAMFGGNCCTHSRFPELCALWKKHVPDQRQRGLWTNGLMKYGQVARDTFWPRARFNLNVHGDARAADDMRKWLPGIPIYGEQAGSCHHAAMLVDRRDYGIGDAEWAGMRERCDINRRWSSSLVQGPDGRPRAYFCEVAGSLSGVRGEDNGLPVEPGWWRWPMARFQSQVASCCDRGCGVPLRARGRQDDEPVYDISPSWRGAAEGKGRGVTEAVHETRPPQVHENTDYTGARRKPLPMAKRREG